MFERFTDRARRVLVLAQQEAHLLKHNFIGTEHILLGLIHEGEGVAARALESLGISPEAVREKVEETIGPTPNVFLAGSPFTPRANKVFELSLREALQLGHTFIGTEHLLLALVREGGEAAQILVSLGADLPGVRRQVIELLSGYQGKQGASGAPCGPGFLALELQRVARDRGISTDALLDDLANALLAAYKRLPGAADEAVVRIDPNSGEIRVYGQELDDEGNVVREWDATPHDFGRIAAQMAKQVILLRIRDAERDLEYEEDAAREGDIVTGVIDQGDNRYTLLDLGRVKARMPQAEQVPFERHEIRARVRAYIVEVRKTTNGPQIVVSRTHPGLIKRLFELEVPEISSGVVEIKAVSREPGHRTKIAVWSNDPSVDAVGACVGARAARMRMVTNELRGEKVDIVPYSDDPAEFIQRALQPARVKEVHLDDETGTAAVIVHDFQLSLAIGKEGQNARLAARLTGWRVDIKSESQLAGGPGQTTPPVPGLRSRGGAYVGPPDEPPTCPTCHAGLAEHGVWSTLSFPSTEEGGAPRSFTVISCRACGTVLAVLPGDSRP